MAPAEDMTEDTTGEASSEAAPYVPRRTRRTREQRGWRGKWNAFRALPAWQQWMIAIPSALVLILALGGVGDAFATAGRVHPGVTAAGVDIGGLKPEAAQERLTQDLSARMGEPVEVRFEETTWTVTAKEIGADADEAAAVASAMRIGRSGGIAAVTQRVRAWFASIDVEVPVSTDATATGTFMDTIAKDVDRAPKDASVSIDGTTATLVSAEVGVAVRREQVRDGILTALTSQDRGVEVSVDFVPVSVTDDDARQALADAKMMMSSSVKVTYEKESWSFEPAQIAKWIAFRAVSAESTSAVSTTGTASAGATGSATATAAPSAGPARMVLEAYIDANEASKTVTPKVGEAGRPAVDATFKVSNGAVSIVPSQDGVGADIADLATEMSRVLVTSGERVVELRTQRVEPKITTAVAKKMGIKERISTYTTTYDAGNKPRVNNIHTLADSLDGTLVAPGDTFSFNGTVGERTAAKGYQEAPAIVNGKLVPQLGGGICQVGTTIFNAVFESGLPVIERRNHSFYISHYPTGRDATVSWGGPDFKFKNDTENWVLVATGYTSSSLTISLYGTDPGYTVKASQGSWTDIKPHPVKEVKDATMPVGSRVVEDTGVDGRTIVVTRTVTKDGKVVREDSFKSVYKTKEEVVRVGTKDVSSKTATKTTQ